MNFGVCSPLIILFILGIIDISFNQYLKLSNATKTIDIITIVILLFFTRWLCINNKYKLAWLVVVISAIVIFTGIFLYKTNNQIFMDALKVEQTHV